MAKVMKGFFLVSLFFLSSIAYAEDVFKVGVIAPLSGPLAEYGLAAQNGIQLARAQHATLFDKMSFIFEDSQWDAKQAVSAFGRLRDSEKCSIVFNWGNPTTEAVAPIAEQSKLPLIGMTLDPRSAIGRKYVIRSTNAASDFAAVMAKYLKQQGYKKIGIIISENTYVQGLYDGLEAALGNSATLEVLDSYNIQDQDFRSSVAKLRNKKFDALGVFLISGQVNNFYRQLQSQNIKLPTFGTDFFESTTEIHLANGGMSGAVYPHLGITDSFRKEYTSKFGNDYQIAYAGNAYDMAMLLGKLFNSTSIPNADQIITSLEKVQNEPGIGGVFSYSKGPQGDAHFHFPVQLKQIIGEEIKVL